MSVLDFGYDHLHYHFLLKLFFKRSFSFIYFDPFFKLFLFLFHFQFLKLSFLMFLLVKLFKSLSSLLFELFFIFFLNLFNSLFLHFQLTEIFLISTMLWFSFLLKRTNKILSFYCLRMINWVIIRHQSFNWFDCNDGFMIKVLFF